VNSAGDIESVLLVAAALLILAMAASKASGRFGIPAVLLFLVLGMLAGSDGPGGIEFDDFDVAQSVGIVALAYILFSGGLDTRWIDVRPVLGAAASLATVGVALTALITGLAAMLILDVPFEVGLLLGAIVSSTDAAAVFSILRSRGVGLRGRLRPLLELESGSNDPMAVFLTIGFLELVTDDASSPLTLAPLFAQQMAVGGFVGYAIARLAVVGTNRIRLDYIGLYPVLTIAVVALAYAAAALLGGSGFLAVYIVGLVFGNSKVVHRASLMRFHDAIAWIMQIGMFLVLGLLVFPSDVVEVAARALAVAAVLVVVARPVATFVALGFSTFGTRERLLVSWVGLRGAVPIVLATYPRVEDVEHADLVFNTVFFIVIVSVLVQGTSIPLVARFLRLDAPPTRPEPTLPDVADVMPGSTLQELEISPGSAADGAALLELRLPGGVLAVLLTRGDAYFVPQGSTVLRGGDRVLVLADSRSLPALLRLFQDGREVS